ncbi:putative DNA-directed RNA polymerase [Rosa chinensis]|uniref:DNA-directed RNA polymerase n=1 Tax=Rosa chinensis TaxID=74649 RepID=A0A2P6QD29_ROSCH|nr:putative DNA-directed RNA polymerase [Rosa chinensis]
MFRRLYFPLMTRERILVLFVLLVLETSSQACTGVLGFLESEENFPFTIQGIVPDIVINPHAFPSRQAPGQLLEAALGKGIACGGSMRYATPFSTPSVDDITDQLHGAGFQRWGNESIQWSNWSNGSPTDIYGPNILSTSHSHSH